MGCYCKHRCHLLLKRQWLSKIKRGLGRTWPGSSFQLRSCIPTEDASFQNESRWEINWKTKRRRYFGTNIDHGEVTLFWRSETSNSEQAFLARYVQPWVPKICWKAGQGSDFVSNQKEEKLCTISRTALEIKMNFTECVLMKRRLLLKGAPISMSGFH